MRSCVNAQIKLHGSQRLFIPSSIWWQPTKMPKYVEAHSGYEPSMHLKTACRLGATADPDKSDGQTHRD